MSESGRKYLHVHPRAAQRRPSKVAGLVAFLVTAGVIGVIVGLYLAVVAMLAGGGAVGVMR